MLSTMTDILEDASDVFEALAAVISSLPDEIKAVFLFFFAAAVIFLVIRAIADISGGS